VVALKDNFLGVGLYSVDEVALYARVSHDLARRWISGADDGKAVISPRLIGDEKFMSFLDLVQMMAIREIRQTRNITLKQIRELLQIAERDHGVSHPFARKGITFQWHNELGLVLPDGKLIEASGKHRGHPYLKEIVVVYKEDLSYDAAGLAELYHAWRWNGIRVEMNPRIRFGEPIVTSCGYSARTLFEAAMAEGSIEKAANAYNVAKEDVETAYRYFDHLKGNEAK
jgi:uncharacterized protein (DUF433 family)